MIDDVSGAGYLMKNNDADMPGMKLLLLNGVNEEIKSIPPAAKVNEVEAPLKSTTLSLEKEKESFCTLIGPFVDLKTGTLFIERLLSLNTRSQMKRIQQDGDLDYLVYIKPEISREMSLIKLKELQDRKIDSFIIPEGEIANGISLGIFDNPANAAKQKQSIENLGYTVEIMPNKRKYVENWIVVSIEDQDKVSDQLLQQINSENLSVVIKKEVCTKVASLRDIQ
jgi:hypothetical protein